MPRSSAPRKPYRPRAIGRPVLARMRNDLILPCHIALRTLERGDDAAALESARHTLAALLDYMLVALGEAHRELGPITAGLDAMRAVVERHERTGTYRATGGELLALRAAVTHSDVQITYLRTHQLKAALEAVDAMMLRLERAEAAA